MGVCRTQDAGCQVNCAEDGWSRPRTPVTCTVYYRHQSYALHATRYTQSPTVSSTAISYLTLHTPHHTAITATMFYRDLVQGTPHHTAITATMFYRNLVQGTQHHTSITATMFYRDLVQGTPHHSPVLCTTATLYYTLNTQAYVIDTTHYTLSPYTGY